MALPSAAGGTPGIKSLQKIQIGKEATPGTAVAATKILRVPGGMLSDDRQVTMVDEMVGIINGTDRSYIAAAQGSISIDSSPLTPQQFPILLAASLGFTYPSAPASYTSGLLDGVSAYRYTVNMPTTSTPVANVFSGGQNVSYTFEAGDNFEAEQMTYGKCTNVSVSGSSGGPITMQGSFIGQDIRYKGAFTSLSTIDTVEDLIFARSRLYLAEPNVSPTFTAVDSTFLGFDVGIDCSWVPKFTGRGNASGTVPTWEFAVFTNYSVSGSFTLEHNLWTSGTANGLKTKWRNQETLIMRIDCWGSGTALDITGSTLTPVSPFTLQSIAPFTSTYAGVRFEFPIKIQQISPLSDNSGNDIVSVSWVAKYNSTYGSTGYILVENNKTDVLI
jgi:hypothetical protein